jgi:hypothetical protein
MEAAMENSSSGAKWTHFHDMHSGGGQKLDWPHIFIEAPQEEAELVFFHRFGRNPNRVTCTCCGPDYSISTSDDLAQATGFERGCAYAYVMPDGSEKSDDDWYALPIGERAAMNECGRYVERPSERFAFNQYCTLEDYMKRNDVTFIPASHIKPEERTGTLPDEGYVWVD